MSTYDVIVVGAGSAGAVLAARLSEDPDRSVLLLEAGPDWRSADALPEIRSVEPAKVSPTQALADDYTYPHLVATRSATQAPAQYFRGRGLGGSSTINGMFAIRATVEDFDGWAAKGCTGWSYEECLPAMREMEDDLDFGDADYHGKGGPIPITRTRREDFTALDSAVDVVSERAGHPWAEDHNAPGSTGTSPFAYNGRDGRRVSTNDGYLEPARDRSNLTIRGGAHVDRVLLAGSRAVGVRVLMAGRAEDVYASEVILAAGTIHSPAILQRSGIGPASLLRRLGLDVVADLPVGLGLQEHPSIAMLVALREPLDYRGHPQRGQVCVRFTSGVGDEVNDLMIANCGALGIGAPVAGIIGWGNRVTSTGSVAITTLDPLVDPHVDFNLLSTPDDLQRFRVLVEHLDDWRQQPEIQALCAAAGFGEDARPLERGMSARAFEEFALAHVGDTVHATSTCTMGTPGEPDVVVDPFGRVVGVEGLRVADASILPWSTRANTNLSSILVGERISQLMMG